MIATFTMTVNTDQRTSVNRVIAGASNPTAALSNTAACTVQSAE